MRKTLVLGLGNDLLGDEGVGVHAVRLFQDDTDFPHHVEFLDGGTLSFTLAGPIGEASELIVIDAAQLHGAPGDVRLFIDFEMDEFLMAGGKRSVHEVGLIDLMAIARLTDSLPARRALIGIQPESVDWADRPSDTVAGALPAVRDITRQLIQGWA